MSKQTHQNPEGKSLYQRMIDAGVRVEGHYSDMYVPDTPQVREIIHTHDVRVHYTSFPSNVAPHEQWLDIPFAFMPYWEAKQKESRT